jgi:hypothetical protein
MFFLGMCHLLIFSKIQLFHREANIEDGHYPIGGDKYLDKQRREEENQTASN